jgi:osmotically-inducible protein OsmY
MKTFQLLSAATGAALLLASGCNRADANREVQRAAAEVKDEVKTVASAAGDRIADGWLVTKVQAKYFADRDIKARYINVGARDGVITLKGYVENPQARQKAVQVARNTEGVRDVDDQLLIGVAPGKDVFETPGNPVATAGSRNDYDATIAANAASASVGDDRITSMVQARFFLEPTLKSRAIDVQTRNAVVTLRGQVSDETERAQALLIAHHTTGVGRVEDLLTVAPIQ